MAVEIKIKNLEKLADLSAKYPAAAEKHVRTAINRSLVRILGAEKTEAPFGVTGQLRDRWGISLGRFFGTLKSGVHYALAVHEGTKPHFVSPSELMPWAAKKGLNPYAVAKNIQKKGTKANPFLKRAVDREAKNVNVEFKDALENTLKEITS